MMTIIKFIPFVCLAIIMGLFFTFGIHTALMGSIVIGLGLLSVSTVYFKIATDDYGKKYIPGQFLFYSITGSLIMATIIYFLIS